MLWFLLAFQVINQDLKYKSFGAFETKEECIEVALQILPSFNPETHQLICIRDQIRL